MGGKAHGGNPASPCNKNSTGATYNVASRAHFRGRLDLEHIADPRARYDGIAAYARSKLANVMHTFALARRLSGTTGHRQLPALGSAAGTGQSGRLLLLPLQWRDAGTPRRAPTLEENPMTQPIRLLFAIVTIAASFAAAAQTPTVRIRGTLEKADGNVLTLKPNDGAAIKLTLTDKAMIVAVVKASMADVKEGTYLGSAAMPQADGSQKALEVHIFPEQMRGTGDGHRPYDPVPNSTMTNGAASGATVTGVDGATMTVKYKNGEKKIVVPANAPIVRYEIGGKADLKPGAKFTVLAATKKADGSFEAPRINVGRDGVVPQ